MHNPVVRIDILLTPSGEYFLKRVEATHKKNPDKETYRKTDKYQLNASDMVTLLKKLSNVTIPASPIHEMGCDGSFTELEIGDYNGKAHYRWWSVPPEGWEVLEEITNTIFSWCEEN